MTRPLVVCGVVLTLAFALLVGALRLRAQNEAVDALFGGCAFPCWQEIQPGVTGRSDALDFLKPRGWMFNAECNAAVYDTCYVFVENEPSRVVYLFIEQERVTQIALLDSGLTVGDLWLAFGTPDYAALPPNRPTVATFFTSLWFGSAGLSARLSIPCPAGYADLLRSRASTILVWQPGTAMAGSVLGTMTDLRQMLRQVCGA